MPYAHDYDDLKVPQEIIDRRSVPQLSAFCKQAYGTKLDNRWQWKRALKEAARLRRRIVTKRKREEQQADAVEEPIFEEIHLTTFEPADAAYKPIDEDSLMYRENWPWKKGFKFALAGPQKNNSCYIRDILKGTDFFCLEEDLPNYLEEGFEIPAHGSVTNDAKPESKKSKSKKSDTKKVSPAESKGAESETVAKAEPAGLTSLEIGGSSETESNSEEG